jgi:hypothetical protein
MKNMLMTEEKKGIVTTSWRKRKLQRGGDLGMML